MGRKRVGALSQATQGENMQREGTRKSGPRYGKTNGTERKQLEEPAPGERIQKNPETKTRRDSSIIWENEHELGQGETLRKKRAGVEE